MNTASNRISDDRIATLSLLRTVPSVPLPIVYVEGHADTRDDIQLRTRYFTSRSSAGLIAGCEFCVMFAIDRPAKALWPTFKDFNLWQGPHNHFYSGVVGDLEGRTFRISLKPNEPGRHQYRVVKVIPEHLIVLFQPIPEEGTGDTYLPGLGEVSPGFHVFLLNDHGGHTIISCLMEHASLMSRGTDANSMTEAEALAPWRDVQMVPEWLRKWRDGFIPTLKAVVSDRGTS